MMPTCPSPARQPSPAFIVALIKKERIKRTGSEDVIVHVLVPCGPQLLKDVKVNIEFGNLVVGSPVRGGIREDSCKVRPAKGVFVSYVLFGRFD
jgi:hypothetical protein